MNYAGVSIDLIALIFILLTVIFIFIRIALRLRKYGGSLTTMMHAATYEFLNDDRRKAVREIVETKAHKKFEEEDSDKPVEE